MFNKWNAEEFGRKGGLAQPIDAKMKGATATSRIKAKSSARNGKLGGRPGSGCTCNLDVHAKTCRVLMAQRKRESRARLAGARPKVVTNPDTRVYTAKEDLRWLTDGIVPRRPEQIGKNRRGNTKRKLFCDR